MDPESLLHCVLSVSSTNEALVLCRPLLRSELTALSAGTALLERIRQGMEDEQGVAAIMQLIKSSSTPSIPLAEQVIHLLPVVEPKAVVALVSTIPALVAGKAISIDQVVEEYVRLMKEDRSLIVPVIGSLHDLPLSAELKSKVAELTLEALALVDEEDVPVVVRTLLRATAPSSVVFHQLRRETAGLQYETIAVMVEVLADAFTQESVAEAFLGSVTAMITTAPDAEDSEMVPLDVIGLLLLLSHPHESKPLQKLLSLLLQLPKAVPFQVLRDLSSNLDSRDLQWVRLLGPMLDLGLWLLIMPSQAGTSGQALRRGACELLFSLFKQHPCIRLRLVSACLSATAAGRGGRQAGKGGASEQPPSAVAAGQLLVVLAKRQGPAMAPYAHSIAEAVMHSSGVAARQMSEIPLTLLCESISLLVPHAQGLLNTLLVHVQKQLLVAGGPVHLHRSQGPAGSAAGNGQATALLLAKQILTQGSWLEPRDRAALINWTVRMLQNHKIGGALEVADGAAGEPLRTAAAACDLLLLSGGRAGVAAVEDFLISSALASRGGGPEVTGDVLVPLALEMTHTSSRGKRTVPAAEDQAPTLRVLGAVRSCWAAGALPGTLHLIVSRLVELSPGWSLGARLQLPERGLGLHDENYSRWVQGQGASAVGMQDARELLTTGRCCATAQAVVAACLVAEPEPEPDELTADRREGLLLRYLDMGARVRCCIAGLDGWGKEKESASTAKWAKSLRESAEVCASMAPLGQLCSLPWAHKLEGIIMAHLAGKTADDAWAVEATSEALELAALHLARCRLGSCDDTGGGLAGMGDLLGDEGGHDEGEHGSSCAGEASRAGDECSAALAVLGQTLPMQEVLQALRRVGEALPQLRKSQARPKSQGAEEHSRITEERSRVTASISRLQVALLHILVQVMLTVRHTVDRGLTEAGSQAGALLPMSLLVLLKQPELHQRVGVFSHVGAGGSRGALLEALFRHLHGCLEAAEDSLHAGLLVELLCLLTRGLKKGHSAASSTWACLSVVYPLEWEGELPERVRAELRRLLGYPYALDWMVRSHTATDRHGRREAHLKALQAPPATGGAPSRSNASPLLQQCLVTHWCMTSWDGKLSAMRAVVLGLRRWLDEREPGVINRSKGLGDAGPITKHTVDLFMTCLLKMLASSLHLSSPVRHESAPYGAFCDVLNIAAHTFALGAEAMTDKDQEEQGSSNTGVFLQQALQPLLRACTTHAKAAEKQLQRCLAWRLRQPGEAGSVHHMEPVLAAAARLVSVAHSLLDCIKALGPAASGCAKQAKSKKKKSAAAGSGQAACHALSKSALGRLQEMVPAAVLSIEKLNGHVLKVAQQLQLPWRKSLPQSDKAGKSKSKGEKKQKKQQQNRSAASELPPLSSALSLSSGLLKQRGQLEADGWEIPTTSMADYSDEEEGEGSSSGSDSGVSGGGFCAVGGSWGLSDDEEEGEEGDERDEREEPEERAGSKRRWRAS
ncbi:unnamed protein product [Chrysoparadoxa australica]